MGILLNNVEYLVGNTPARVQVIAEDGSLVDACPNTRSPIRLVDDSELETTFPSAIIQTLPKNGKLTLRGISNRPTINTYINVSITYPMEDGTTVTFPLTRLYIIQGLPCKILLSLDFLLKNRLDFRFSRKHPCLTIPNTGKTIHVRTKARKERKLSPKPMIYLAELVMIRSGKGVNLAIRHRMLLRRGNGYLITPYPRYNLALGEFSTLINGIVSGASEPIPFSNFGLDIHILVGTCLGHLEEALMILKR
jgi:hypothetical protein